MPVADVLALIEEASKRSAKETVAESHVQFEKAAEAVHKKQSPLAKYAVVFGLVGTVLGGLIIAGKDIYLDDKKAQREAAARADAGHALGSDTGAPGDAGTIVVPEASPDAGR